MAPNPTIKSTAITRAGYEYQDLVGIEILIRHYRDPNLYDWVKVESDDPASRSLDDVVARRKDGSVEYYQVKFTVDPEKYVLDWEWLLEAKGTGSSMLKKWVDAFYRAKAAGPVYSAELRTNRKAAGSFRSCLTNDIVDFDKVLDAHRAGVEASCGGNDRAREFFSQFKFLSNQLDLDRYENALRDRLVPSDTDSSGWLLLRDEVTRWAVFKNSPPEGKILRDHLIQIITRRRPQPIRQDFFVPERYEPPSATFDAEFRARIASSETAITVLWGTPGRGKSTYLSFLTEDLQGNGETVLRHHYFLSSEGPRANRLSYADIAESIYEQIRSRYPEIADGITGDPHSLHQDLKTAAEKLGEKRLFLVIDGLDHVWRDTSRVDQLDHLFNVLLPLPANVSLIVGTQRVPDAQLPKRLLATANDADWIEVPRMDQPAVHKWVASQDSARPFILPGRVGAKRAAELHEIGAALFAISQGHPLHLIYALEGLIRSGKPIRADDIKALPPCPDGDIRKYYKELWIGLSAVARNILHALAGSDFYWPSLGVRQCLGDYGEIEFLLEPSNAGMMPFHQSIFAYVREREDHDETYLALLPRIVSWLESEAPEYWKWGWLWLVQAEAEKFENLLNETTREWVVTSLAHGWPERQIIKILAAAEAKSFRDGDLPHTIRLRSLKTRVMNAREYQAQDYGFFRATALAISDNRQQTLNFAYDLQDLKPDEVTALAKLSPSSVRTEVAESCLKELARRINAWIVLRHQPEHEFAQLSDRLLSAAAYNGSTAVPRTLRYLRGFTRPRPEIARYIRYLGEARDAEALRAVLKALRSKERRVHRRHIQDHLLRTALYAGAGARGHIETDKTTLSAFAASCALRCGRLTHIRFHTSPPHKELLADRYFTEGTAGLLRYYSTFFWTALCTSLQAQGEFSLLYPSQDSEKLGWLESALACLEETARSIASGDIHATYSTIYTAASALEPLDHLGPNDRNGEQYRAFKRSLPGIALDLHLFGSATSRKPLISEAEFNLARQSPQWVDELWLEQNVSNQIPLLERKAADEFIGQFSTSLASRITEFNERAAKWAELASLASLYGVQDPPALIRRSAECLVGHGWRKDLGAMDMLEAIELVHAVNPSQSAAWMRAIAPIVDEITTFTDGDETDHVRSSMIDTFAQVQPDALASLYAHHIASDEWRYADETLEAALGVLDLSSKEAAALAGTLLDDRNFMVLEKRAPTEPLADTLLKRQLAFLGSPQTKPATKPATTERELTPEEQEALKKDPTSIAVTDFAALVAMVTVPEFPYAHRREYMAKWLEHWHAQGKALKALASISEYFVSKDSHFHADEILDKAFETSLAVEGRDTAYAWLVKAHIYRRGWSRWTSRDEVHARLVTAAQTYPDRWREYIRDTSEMVGYKRRHEEEFTLGYRYLVRFLILVGQVDTASAITQEFVNTFVSEVRDQPIGEATWLN